MIPYMNSNKKYQSNTDRQTDRKSNLKHIVCLMSVKLPELYGWYHTL